MILRKARRQRDSCSKLLLLLVGLLLLSSHSALAQTASTTTATNDQQSTPGEGDIAIMQKEIKWGMQEMQRYKLLKGEWPVRPMAATAEAEFPPKKPSLSEDESTKSIRGQKPKETAHSNYWNLLVSVF